MTDKIEPALSAEGWAYFREEMERRKAINDPDGAPLDTIPLSSLRLDGTTSASAIAKANDLLPDSDPRKITHEKLFGLVEVIANLRAAVETGGFGKFLAPQMRAYLTDAECIADALESYLPPEPT